MLESVLPIIDRCVCIDTGSTDNSKKIVKDFFEKNNKQCDIYDHPFVNFSNARNFALSKVKGKADYGFWIDCDEVLILPNDFNISNFKNKLSEKELYTSIVKSGQNTFARRNFFKTDKRFRWIGAVHEVLVCDDEITVGNFTEIITFVNFDGNSWTKNSVKEKYLRHAQILEDEVKRLNQPRDVFYLAQSYKDAGENEKAIEWYRKRVLMLNGFYEERYYSQFMIGILYDRLNKPLNETLVEYLKCSELDTMRAEHILNSIIVLQRLGLYQTSYVMSDDAVKRYHGKNPYPDRLLFIDDGTYNGKLISVNNTNKKVLGKHDSINGYEINDYTNHIHLFSKLFEYKKFNSVFEYGCGLGSTPFFLDNCNRVVAVEMQDEIWYNKVIDKLKHKYGDKLELHCKIGAENFNFIKRTDVNFDLIFVDGHGGSRPECINICFDLGYEYIVTHDTEDKVYPYGWERINVPNGYYRYDFKEYRNWTTLFTKDVNLYNLLIEWKPFDNKLK